MGFIDSIENFFDSASDKARDIITTIYTDGSSAAQRVYGDIEGTASSVVLTASDDTHVLATGLVKDTHVALDTTKDIASTAGKTITSLGNNAKTLGTNVATSTQKLGSSLGVSTQKLGSDLGGDVKSIASSPLFLLAVAGAGVYLLKYSK